MTAYYDTFQNFVAHCDSLLSTMCYSLLHKDKNIRWQFRSGSVSDDGTCTAEFDAPTSIKGRRYYQKITVSDGNTTGFATII